MSTIKAEITFTLVDKKIGDEDVAGLVDFSFEPSSVDVGKKAIQMIESIASPKVVVAFTDPKDIMFFVECDWANGEVYDGQILVASDVIDESKFDGNIW
jgi:hypothetical protein